MTITFNCPKCENLCAFHDIHAGKRAKCTKCWQVFVIPPEDGQKPEKVKIKEEFVLDGPFSGFYRAVFRESWKIFSSRQNIVVLLLITTLLCFKFFLGGLYSEFSAFVPATGKFITIPLPIGALITLFVWAFLFWYYTELIYSTAFGLEVLPHPHIESVRELEWNIIRSAWMLFISLAIVLAPAAVAFLITLKIGSVNRLLVYGLAILGFFFFPMTVLIVSIGRDVVLLFRLDYIVKPIVRAFRPYTAAAVLTIAAAFLQFRIANHIGHIPSVSVISMALYLLANFAVQVIIIISMRSIGLFYRHYGCFVPW